MAKKIKIRELPSKVKELKESNNRDPSHLEEEVEHTEVISDLVADEIETTPVVPTLRSAAQRSESQDASEIPERAESAPARPIERTRPLYQPSKAGSYSTVKESQEAESTESRETFYEDPMAASVRRTTFAEKPTTTLREELTSPSRSLAQRSASEQEPLRRDALERERTYTPEQERETRQKKRSYPWEA